MKKLIIILVSIFSISLTGCTSIEQKKVDSIEVNKYEYGEIFNSIKSQYIAILTKETDIDMILGAIKDKEKTNEQLDQGPPKYSLNIIYDDKSNEKINLWLSEKLDDKGIISYNDELYYINKESNKTIIDILNSLDFQSK